jgi:ABC-type branched-subunit amino acid transport system substrate-binding protein
MSGQRLRVGACLSLTGRYSQFGVQAAQGLEAWRILDGNAEILIEDDAGEADRVRSCLLDLAGRCDVLLGPYSTQLMRTAARVATDLDRLVWNHGGSGDDVEAAAPGHVVSVLSPTSRYSEPFLRHLAAQPTRPPLWLAHGRGSFGRQIVAGAAAFAEEVGVSTVRIGPADHLPIDPPEGWDLFCAGSFEEDTAQVTAAVGLGQPPRLIGAVAAGVHQFAQVVPDAEGIYGIAQWFRGHRTTVDLGPTEEDFLSAYSALTTAAPDYPAVQAAAAAALATHCIRVAGSAERADLWATAARLKTTTLYGPFGIDPTTGAQLDHETTLVRWTASGLAMTPLSR